MNHSYQDITSRIQELPKWWDEQAVPRYCDFTPREVANIYADECALVEIACQNCGQRFPVAFSKSRMDIGEIMRKEKPVSLADRIRDGSLHYGDPPNFGCCAAGPTMNCEDIHVIEYWHRHDERWTGPDPRGSGARVVTDSANYFGWQRDGSLEIDLPDADEQVAAFFSPRTTRKAQEIVIRRLWATAQQGLEDSVLLREVIGVLEDAGGTNAAAFARIHRALGLVSAARSGRDMHSNSQGTDNG